jgi:uncharacterized protein YacL
MKNIIGLLMAAGLLFANTTKAAPESSTSGFLPLITGILLMMLGVMYFTSKKQKTDMNEIKQMLKTGKINTDSQTDPQP